MAFDANKIKANIQKIKPSFNADAIKKTIQANNAAPNSKGITAYTRTPVNKNAQPERPRIERINEKMEALFIEPTEQNITTQSAPRYTTEQIAGLKAKQKDLQRQYDKASTLRAGYQRGNATGAAVDANNVQLRMLQKQLNDITKELDAHIYDPYDAKKEAKINQLESVVNADDFTRTRVNGKNISGNASLAESIVKYIYDEDYRKTADSTAQRSEAGGSYFDKYLNLTDKEKSILGYYAAKGDWKSADEYIKNIEPRLNERLAAETAESIRAASEKNPLIGAGISALSGFATPVTYGANIVQGISDRLSGSEDAIRPDMSSEAYLPAIAAQASREGVGDAAYNAAGGGAWGDAAKFAADTGISIVNFASKLPLGATGALAEMGLDVAGQTTYDTLQKGGTREQAAALGTMAGAIEILTEKLPLDNLFRLAESGGQNGVRQAIRYLLSREGMRQVAKQSGIEFTEELVSEVANNIAETAVLGDLSDYTQYVNDLKEQGYPDQMANAEAFFQFYVVNAGKAGLGGALSGGFMGASAPIVGGISASMANRSSQTGTPNTTAETTLETSEAVNPSQTSKTVSADTITEEPQNAATTQKMPVATTLSANEVNTLLESPLYDRYIEQQGMTRSEFENKIATDNATALEGMNGIERQNAIYNLAAQDFINNFNTLNASKGDRKTVNTVNRIKNNAQNFNNETYRYIAQQNGVETANKLMNIANRLGVNVLVADQVAGGNANASITGRTIVIERGNKNPIRFLLGHEFLHRMQDLAPDAYKQFRDIVSQDKDIQAKVKRVQDAYKSRFGSELDYDAALDEVAADFAGRIMEDSDFLDNFIETHKENRTMLEKIRDAIRSIIDKLTGEEKRRAQTAEGKLTAALEAAEAQAKGKLKSGENNNRYSINPDFAGDIDQWDGKRNTVFNVGNTSDALSSIGVQNRKIVWYGTKIAEILKKHSGMSRDVIKQVPNILEHPVVILKSKNSNSRLVIFGEVYDNKGTPVTAVIELQPTNKGGEILDLNVIASAYGKDSNLPEFIKQSDLLYLDKNKKRTNSWLKAVGLQLPSVANNIYGSIGNVTYQNGKVKINGVPFTQYMQNYNPNLPGGEDTKRYSISPEQDSEYMELAKDPEANNDNPDIRYSAKPQNPVDIAKNTKVNSAGLESIAPKSEQAQGNSLSRFVNSIRKGTTIYDDVKQEAYANTNITAYNRIANSETMNAAYAAIEQGGSDFGIKWNSKKLSSAQDIAEGILLLDRYQKAGDYASALAVMEKLRAAGTKFGQATQAFSLLSRLTPEGMLYYAQKTLYDSYDKIVGDRVDAWAKRMKDQLTLTDADIDYIKRRTVQAAMLQDGRDKNILLGEIAARIQNKIPPSKLSMLKSLARVSMLLNVKTNVRNVLGNTIIMPAYVVSDFVSSAIDKQLSKTTGNRTTGNYQASSLKAMKKGVYESFDDFRRQINTRDISGNRFEIGSGKSFTERTAIGRALNTLDRVCTFFLDAGDRPFYEMWFTNSLNNQMRLNNATSPTADMIDIATQEALQRTWQDSNYMTKAISGLRDSLNGGKEFGLGTIAVPFTKTPANLTKAMIDFSPVGYLRLLGAEARNFTSHMKNGTATPQMQRAYVEKIGKATAGTLIMAMAAATAAAGLAVGSGDDDKDVAQFEKNILGKRPYSIRIGDKSFSYDWAAPIGGQIAIVADIMKNIKQGKNAFAGNITSSAGNAIFEAFKAGGNTLFDQSVYRGITELFSSDDIMTGLIDTAFNFPSQVTPQQLSQVAQLIDDTQRATYQSKDLTGNTLRSMQAKIPFARNELAPAIDVFGREIKTKNDPFNVLLNPANISTANPLKAGNEVYSLYEETGDTSVFPRYAPYSVRINGETKRLTPAERAEYQRTMGQISREGIETLMESRAYQSLSGEDKVEVISDIYGYGEAIAKKSLGYTLSSATQKAYDAYEKGISPAEYYLYRLAADTDGNNTISQEEAISALDSMQLDDTQRAYLYALTNKGWKNNPYE